MARPIHQLIFFVLAGLSWLVPANAKIAFPDTRPDGGNFVRPERGTQLMHSDYKLSLDEDRQMFTERRGGLVMNAKMYSTIPMQFSQSNECPVDPRTGFPEESLEDVPEKIWHFKADSKGKARQFRMVTLMTVERPGEKTDAMIERDGNEVILLDYRSPGAENTLKINLATDAANIVELKSKLREGSIQSLIKP